MPVKGKAGPRPAAKKDKKESVPKQPRLPGTEDAAIQELEDAATEYAAVLARRIALTAQEVDLKDDILRLLKLHKKDKYHRDGIEVTRIFEKEKVRVKIDKHGE